MVEAAARRAVAVTGMAARLPGAPDVDAFWRNLRQGVESVVFFSPAELAAAGVEPEVLMRPDYVPARAPLDDVELFDAPLFGISPREAEMMDPQHRLFLECALHALEDAGCDPERFPGSIGIFGGANVSTYLANLYSQPERVRDFGSRATLFGIDKDYLTSRVAYKLNLRGPAVTVQTACSTSLVAVHLACQSLLNGECDLALAGGVALSLPERAGYTYEEQGISSPDGHCRAFDAAARGTVSGSGVGLVVLRPLAAALRARDAVRAVILASAVNNDGARKVSYTAPSVAAQAALVAEALAVAGVPAESIGMVEAHGTGTALGDPVEVAALTRAFRGHTAGRGFCALGSVKTNLGHLDAASGIAGLIKTVLALDAGEIPPTLHFQAPNPQIDLAASPFFVNASPLPWPRGPLPRRAGVSSLGIGGTNAHVVLEEAPPAPVSTGGREAQLLVLSAHTAAALEAATDRAAAWLAGHPGAGLADAAFTWQTGRRVWAHRRTLVAGSPAEAAAALAARQPGRVRTRVCEARARPVCFLLSGQGTHHPGMGAHLYRAEPVFRAVVDQCAEVLAEPPGLDLRRLLAPAPGEEAAASAAALAETAAAQPALFAFGMALARLWQSWGVVPRAMLGHSLGEYVAACLAGVFTLPDALRLVALRGRLMQETAAGAMLAVELPAAELEADLEPGLSIAAVNGPRSSVTAGPLAAVERLAARCAARGVPARRLHTSRAFHSAAMDPVLDELRRAVREVPRTPPTIPYLSNLTGTWQSAEAACDPSYWARHLREPVRFGDGLAELLREPAAVLLEVGPGDSIANLARQHPARRPEQTIVASLRDRDGGETAPSGALEALAQLWMAGVEVDWEGFHAAAHPRRLALPGYPFERHRFWVERRAAPAAAAAAAQPAAGVPGAGTGAREEDPAAWLWAPAWERVPAPPAPGSAASGGGRWLLLSDDAGIGAEIARRLRKAGGEVVTVGAGGGFAVLDGGRRYTVDPARRSDFQELARELARRGELPARLVHLWAASGRPHAYPAPPASRALWYGSLLHLAAAVAGQRPAQRFALTVVSRHVQAVSGDDELHPERAALLGACRVIPQEYPHIACRSVDCGRGGSRELAARLTAELLASGGAAAEPAVAWRGAYRWALRYRRLTPPGEPAAGARDGTGAGQARALLRPRGVYLVTGGTGQLGLALAAHLAQAVAARLVLVGRSPLPPRDEWEALAAAPAAGAGDAATGRRLRALLALTAAGGEVMTAAADVADRRQMAAVLAAARRRFGAVHGVIHAAGTVEARSLLPIHDLQGDEIAELLHPRLGGLEAMARACAREPLDFLVVCASLAGILGGLGYAAYAAASACLDAWVQERSRRCSTPLLVVDWDAWRMDGPAAVGLGARLSEMALSPAEGAAVFARLLARDDGPQVAVSTRDLAARLAEWSHPAAAAPAAGAGGDAAERHPRPALSTPHVAPRGPTEERLVEIWGELLGIAEIGVHDDFFELGGHSLVGIRLSARLREEFAVDLSLRALFASPTVAQLALAVEAELIRQLDELSDEEAAALLAPAEAGSGMPPPAGVADR